MESFPEQPRGAKQFKHLGNSSAQQLALFSYVGNRRRPILRLMFSYVGNRRRPILRLTR